MTYSVTTAVETTEAVRCSARRVAVTITGSNVRIDRADRVLCARGVGLRGGGGQGNGGEADERCEGKPGLAALGARSRMISGGGLWVRRVPGSVDGDAVLDGVANERSDRRGRELFRAA